MSDFDSKRASDLLEKIVDLLEEIRNQIAPPHHKHKPVTGFTIETIGPMNPIIPGSTAVYTATPEPVGAALIVPPTWISSDTVNAPVTVDATGLIATVSVPATAVPGPSTLSIIYSNADA